MSTLKLASAIKSERGELQIAYLKSTAMIVRRESRDVNDQIGPCRWTSVLTLHGCLPDAES